MEKTTAVKARDSFTTGFGVLAATLGSAVGLGVCRAYSMKPNMTSVYLTGITI
jgi:SNF family Na+-dependent transporter